jgi:ABC-2 type transport system permease protein
MNRLVRSELLKLRTVPMTAWLLAATVLVAALEVMGFVLGAGDGVGPGQRHDPDLLSYAVASASAAEIIVMVLGIMILTHEYRFGTATATFLVTPRRGSIVGAKMIAVSLLGFGFALLSMAIVVPLSVWLIHLRGGPLTWDHKVAEVLLAVVVVMVLYGPLGIAIAALVRNQIAAIAGSLTWLFVIDGVLAAFLPDVERWTPGGATGAVLQVGTWVGTKDMLPPWLGGVTLIAWTALFALVGTRVAVRRDIT